MHFQEMAQLQERIREQHESLAGVSPRELLLLQGCVDLFTGWTDRKLLGVAVRDPLLAAECTDRLAGDRRLNDLLLADIM